MEEAEEEGIAEIVGVGIAVEEEGEGNRSIAEGNHIEGRAVVGTQMVAGSTLAVLPAAAAGKEEAEEEEEEVAVVVAVAAAAAPDVEVETAAAVVVVADTA